MEKPARCKAKNKKQPAAKSKTAKKRKSDGPSCSMFIAEISRKMSARRREEAETPQNIVQTIIDNIANALPIKISMRSPSKTNLPVQIETLQKLSPELLPNDTISIPHSQPIEVQEVDMHDITGSTPMEKSSFKMPKGLLGMQEAGREELTVLKTISPVQIETLKTLSPELIPKDTISIRHPHPIEVQVIINKHNIIGYTPVEKSSFKMPKDLLGVRDAGREKPTAPKTISPVQIETLTTLSPELLPNDTISIPQPQPTEVQEVVMHDIIGSAPMEKSSFKMPKMPVISSDVMKVAVEKRRKLIMKDGSTTTERDADVASEIAKHVETLRKISLIAEEFNQKTSKNLKEICDSVQEDLLKKLEEVQVEQKVESLAQAQLLKIQEERMEVD